MRLTKMEVVRRGMPGTGDDDIAVPITSGLVVDPPQDKLMQFLQYTLIKRDIFLHQAFQKGDRVGID